MFDEAIDAICSDLDTIQGEYALTDRAIAAGIQLFTRTGSFPEGFPDEPKVERVLLKAAALLFLSAPAKKNRYLIVSSMHLNLVVAGDRPLDTIFDELRTLEKENTAPPSSQPPEWLKTYSDIGATALGDADDPEALRVHFDRARSVLREHHEQVLDYTRQLLDSLATDFDQEVREGVLSDLGPKAEESFDFEDIDQALKEAQKRQNDGDLQGALRLYSHVLTEQPDDVDTIVRRGILRASFEDLEEARDDFDRALELDDQHLQARLNRALVLHSLGEIEAAIEDYDRALHDVDDNAEIWTNRGIARFSAHQLQGALDDFNRAIELDDSMAQAYLQRGNVRRVLKEVGYALRDYEQALSLEPDFVDAYSARGFLYLQLEDVDKALTDFDRALDLQPSDPTLYYNRAHAHLLRDDAQSAIADYDRALALDPEDVETLTNRGAARMMDGDLDGAVEDWETAIAINPYHPTPYLKRASLWIATEQPEEAARDLQIALDTAPDDWPHRQEVAQTLKNLLDELGFDQPD